LSYWLFVFPKRYRLDYSISVGVMPLMYGCSPKDAQGKINQLIDINSSNLTKGCKAIVCGQSLSLFQDRLYWKPSLPRHVRNGRSFAVLAEALLTISAEQLVSYLASGVA